jgi:hypothetical protein
MRDLLNLIRWLLLGLLRSRRSLEAENLALRHQLTVLHRSAPKRPTLRNFDRLVFVCLYRIAPRILDALTIVEPETVVRFQLNIALKEGAQAAAATYMVTQIR